MGREIGGRFKREGIYVYIWLIHVEVWQKTVKFWRAIILWLKSKKKKFFFKKWKRCRIQKIYIYFKKLIFIAFISEKNTNYIFYQYFHIITSVQFNHSVVSDYLWPHELQHARPPCPSPTPGVYPNSCPLSQWCHPTISSSVIPFSSCPQSFPASGSFKMSQLFASGGQSTGVSASASVLPMNIQDWFPSGLTGWISLQSKVL